MNGLETGKICRLLIAVFVVLNIMFLLLYYSELNGAGKLTLEFAQNVAENLSKRGISVTADTFVLELPENGIYMLELPDRHDSAKNTANNISVSEFKGISSEIVSFEIPDGVSMSIYDSKQDTSELAKLQIKFEDFGIQYANALYAGQTDSDDGVSQSISELSGKQKQRLDAFVNALNSDGTFGYRIMSLENRGFYVIAEICQTAGGTDITGMTMKISISAEDYDIMSASGNWITFPVSAKYTDSLTDGINIIYKLDLENVSAVNSERIVYSARNVRENVMYLVPVWEISYNNADSDELMAYIDALN